MTQDILSFDQFQKLNESSLTRVFSMIKEHDCGFITSYRGFKTNAINQASNKKLLTQLRAKDFGVTKVKGSYIENFGTDKEKEVSEESFFVVDLTDRGDLRKVLEELGNEYDQDSILFVPMGGETGLLIGTNETGYPGMGDVVKFNNPVFGASGEFMTRVNGRPFIFKESLEAPVYQRMTSVEKRSIVQQAKMPIDSFLD
jgi:hypothetical protein